VELFSRHGSKSGTEPSQENEEDDGWHIVCNVKNSRGKKPSTGFSVTFTVEGPKALNPTAIPFVPSHLKDLEAPSATPTSNAVRIERKDDPPVGDHGLVAKEHQDGAKVFSTSGLPHLVGIATFKDDYTAPKFDTFCVDEYKKASPSAKRFTSKRIFTGRRRQAKSAS
jgi:hypothetical protein